MREIQARRARIDREIHAIADIRVNVELVKPHSLERFVGEARRVVDHRKVG